MKKLILTNCITIFLAGFSFAQGIFVSAEKAQLVAIKYFYEHHPERMVLSYNDIAADRSYAIEENDHILYYVFDISPSGFVAVSAYEGIMPVLFYSFTGNYASDNQPLNFAAWVSQYARQISYAISTKAAGSDEAKAIWNYYLATPANSLEPFSGREVLPMLTSTWDQGTYYNAMCPEDPAGPAGHCVTGCVATALGQLVNYFRWPESGTGSYSYDCPPYGTLSVDFSSASYEWDLMENELNHSNPEVAEIIYHLGVSVDMVYGPDGSGMYNHKAAYTLKTYFKYSPETQYVYRDSTTMDWDSLLITHLDNKIPVYYAGWSVPDTNGHAFICDGYQGENYYHFNWGWSGSYDGYFYTDNLTPGGNLFNLAQELVINAVPDTNLYPYPVGCDGEKNYTALSGTLDDGSGPLYAYSNGSDCHWQIIPADSVNGITLNFHRFGIYNGDSLKIYDGTDSSAPVLGIFSGNEIPDPVTSSGGGMYISFHTDNENTGEGFLASFESEIPVYCSGMTLMNAQTDTLSDGSGTWNYHDNSACLWRIMPEGASSMTLYFMSFETEAGYDFLKIYDLQTSQLLAEYSGTYPTGLPDPVTSPSGKMFITFNTNSMNSASGWEAYYESNLVNIENHPELTETIIFPNPVKHELTIQSMNNAYKTIKLTLTDLSGRTILVSEDIFSGQNSIQINLESLVEGIYILGIETNDGRKEHFKIIRD